MTLNQTILNQIGGRILGSMLMIIITIILFKLLLYDKENTRKMLVKESGKWLTQELMKDRR